MPASPWTGGPVYSIAEIGVNHGGSLPQALRMVDAAAQAGVTAIKLQSIVADRLVAPSARLGHVGAASLVDFFRNLSNTGLKFRMITAELDKQPAEPA